MKRYIPEIFKIKMIIAFDIKSDDHGEINCGVVECTDGGYKAFAMQHNEEIAELGDLSLKNLVLKVYEMADKIHGHCAVADVTVQNSQI